MPVFSLARSIDLLNVYEFVIMNPFWKRRSTFICSALYSDLFSLLRTRDVPVRL